MKIDPSNPDVRHDPREVDPDMPLDVDGRFDPDMEIGPEDAENCSYSDEEVDTEKADLNDDGKLSEYKRKRGEAIAKAMKKEKERAGQDHARAVADHYEDEEEEQEVAMSPQAIQRAMLERGRNEMHRHHQIERMFRHGY